MDRITEVVNRSEVRDDKTPKSSASLKMMKANSPPGDSNTATRAARGTSSPNAGPDAKSTAHFTARNATTPNVKVGSSCATKPGSKPAPAAMKKTPNKMPSKGLISAWIWARYLFPANKTPAAKAPVVADKPIASARRPMPIATNNVAATNVSVDRAAATASKATLSTRDPRNNTAQQPTVALKANRAISPSATAEPPPATNGKATRIGATARSCSNNILRAAAPSGRSFQPRASSTGKARADDDNDPAAATQNAATGVASMVFSRASSMGMPIDDAALSTMGTSSGPR